MKISPKMHRNQTVGAQPLEVIEHGLFAPASNEVCIYFYEANPPGGAGAKRIELTLTPKEAQKLGGLLFRLAVQAKPVVPGGGAVQ